MYPEAPVLSFVFAALALVPPFWYLRASNIAAVAIGIWLSVTNLIYAVDSLVWAGDANTAAQVWCDISTSIITGSRIAVPAACFAICIHLERLASFSQSSTPQAKRRRIIFECLMCIGLPVVYIALHLIVQPRRFDLFYGFGCRPSTYPTVASIFLVMIPPLLLTVATIVWAGVAWRHFLVHGVQFSGKRGSISSLTRSLYLQLVGMALLETTLSAVLIIVVMWGVLLPGLAPVGSMTWHLSEVLVWNPDAITYDIRTALEIEWSVTVIQSAIFFGLFACRMEVARKGWERIRWFLPLWNKADLSVRLEQDISEKSSTSPSVLTLPHTVVDLSLVIESASTFTPYGSKGKAIPTRTDSSLVEDIFKDVVVSTVESAMIPLESPSRASAIASSHNSLESDFDPNQFGLSLDAFPQTPSSIPTRPPRRFSTTLYSVPQHLGELSRFDVETPFSRIEPTFCVRTPVAIPCTSPPGHRPEHYHAVYAAVVRETKREPISSSD